MKKKIIFFIATCGGIGFAPIFPGTAMSLVAVLCMYFMQLSPIAILTSCLVLTILGIWVCNYVEKELGFTDPSCAVIDELVGMWLALLWVPHTLWCYLIVFSLFRFFDGTKWLGGTYLESLPGGWGIMLDDVYAASQTLLVFHGIKSFVNFW